MSGTLRLQDAVDQAAPLSPPEVSVVVCTFDRPDALHRLLLSIEGQTTSRIYEVVVVDNHPASDANRELEAKFPLVRWMTEPRKGLSFARNAGIRAVRSDVIVFVDDDIEVPPGWLDALVAPVADGGFDIVFGPTLPSRLESPSERIFEAYGGHGHQRSRATFDMQWLRSCRLSLPLWQVGGVGNAAVRRSLFDVTRAGGFEEALGVGSPAGSWEDLYFIYRALRTNGCASREPAASVKHAHRETMAGLSKQLCDYRRGEVCFCLLVLFRHGDLRGLTHLCLWIPAWRISLLLGEVSRRLRGKRLYPLPLMARETVAYFSGPIALISSLRRAARLRRDS
jgi:glycosyltransferase involved in cell wall biosynthesis